MEYSSKEMACVHADYTLADERLQFALFTRKEKEGEGSKKQTG